MANIEKKTIRMLKICWLSSCIFSDEAERETGTWLKPLAEGLVRTGEVELYNITRNFGGPAEQHNRACGVTQWILPRYRHGEGLLPDEPRHVCQRVQAILDEIRPDVVHIWGTEFKWASIYERGYIHYPCFVDMQGVLTPCAEVYFADLQGKERRATSFGWPDLLHLRTSHWWRQRNMEQRAAKERRQLPQFSHISVQSNFVARSLHAFAPEVKLLRTGIILRKEFYQADNLRFEQTTPPRIFTISSSYDLPFKGLHTVLKAMLLLRRQYPDIELWMAGRPLRTGRHASGYERWLNAYIDDNGLRSHIRQLGSLNASQMLAAMQQCTLGVVSSFVESYCLGFAEMMMAGMACITARSGAMPELATDGTEALFFEAGDSDALAQKTAALIDNADWRASLGQAARLRRLRDNAPEAIVEQQIQNYKTLIEDYRNTGKKSTLRT